jgi:hypothetical protein
MAPRFDRSSATALLVAVLVLFVGATPKAHASKLHLVVPSVTGFASDGATYVAWQTSESSPLTVLNTSTRRE